MSVKKILPRASSGTSAPRAEYRIRAKVWRYSGKGGWHFVTVSKRVSNDIRDLFGAEARGWGSLPVLVRVGKAEWKTSLFPDRKAGAYLLAIKADVRRTLRVGEGDTISATIGIR